MRVLLCAAILWLGSSACTHTEPKDDVLTDYASQQRTASSQRLQGAWVVDGKSYFERELGDATPEFIDELLRRRKMGYLIDGDTLEYWVTTAIDRYIMRTKYAIVAEEENAVEIRLLDDERNDTTQQIAGDSEALRFVFVGDDRVEFRTVFAEDEDNGSAEPPSIPLNRVDKEAFDAYFEPTAEATKDDEVATYLRGAWVLDQAATVARLPEEQRPMNGFTVRFTPLTFTFDAQERVHAEELNHTGLVSVDAIYQVVRGEDGLRLEFWATDGQKAVDTEPMTVAYVEPIDADHVSITPVYRYSMGVPLARRVFRRVDEAALEAYRETPPNVGQLGDADRKALEAHLQGAWVSNTKKTLAKHASYNREEMLSDEELGRIGMEFKEDHALHMSFSNQDDRQESEATYTLLDARNNVLILGIQHPRGRGLDEFVLIMDADDQLQLKPTSGEHRTQAEADSETIVFDRVSAERLQQLLEEETARGAKSTE